MGKDYRTLGGLILLCILVPWAFSQQGCEPYGATAATDADTVSGALSAHFGEGDARMFLYRIKSRNTHERLGIGRSFVTEERRQVRAVLQMDGLNPGTALLLHLMWINPEGKEVFTKEVHILPGDWNSEARRDTLRKSRVMLDPDAGFFEMESRYGVSPSRIDEELHKPEDKRRFKPGTWTVRAYLFRKLLLETSFELRFDG
ncbi:MAG: hypothetical protein KAY24_08305 [Candidatus Eisenbacteria sp.]|nr:hypothetical protein [Candidatus Eisenbacteria bacterium]